MKSYQPDATLLRDRIILITGASHGIGRSVALAAAQHGATVILLARSVKQLESLYDEIIESGAPLPAIYPCNLTSASPQDYEELAQRIQKEFGRLDGLLHNAAMLGNLAPLQHYDIRQWYSVMQTNLNAPFMISRATLPLLKESKDASIVFTEDDFSTHGHAYWGAYGVSKIGLTGLRQILADELENYVNLRVNSINPGKLRTRLRANAYPAEDSEGLPKPETVVPAYLYLLGPDSRDLKGCCLNAQSAAINTDEMFNISTASS